MTWHRTRRSTSPSLMLRENGRPSAARQRSSPIATWSRSITRAPSRLGSVISVTASTTVAQRVRRCAHLAEERGADRLPDPRIGVIKVSTITATYALVRRNAVSRGVEIAKGAVTGEAPSVNKLRELSAADISTCKSSTRPCCCRPLNLMPWPGRQSVKLVK